MGVTFDKTIYTGRRQAFWRGEAKILPGGFHVTNRVNIGTVIKRGAFVQVDMDSLSCAIVKVGQVLTGGTTTKPRVGKDNYFEVGDTVFKVGGNAVGTIKDIDRTNDAYDVITLAAAYTGLAEGDFLVEGKDEGGAKAAYTPNYVIGEDKEWKKQGSEAVDVAYDVLVIKPNVPAFPAEWLVEGGYVLKTNPNIHFINQ